MAFAALASSFLSGGAGLGGPAQGGPASSTGPITSSGDAVGGGIHFGASNSDQSTRAVLILAAIVAGAYVLSGRRRKRKR